MVNNCTMGRHKMQGKTESESDGEQLGRDKMQNAKVKVVTVTGKVMMKIWRHKTKGNSESESDGEQWGDTKCTAKVKVVVIVKNAKTQN